MNWDAAAAVGEIVNCMIPIYQVADLEITYEITAIVVRTTDDDPYTSTVASRRLTEFDDTWENEERIPRDVAHLFTGEPLDSGIQAGYPVVDIKITVNDGSFHEVDSDEMAFRTAGRQCFKSGAKKADPIILEPFMKTEVITPEDNMGDVIGDLNSRRGRVLGVDPKPPNQVIRAEVPLAEMLKYAPDLRSMTSGRGDFHMGFSKYEEVPGQLAERVMKEVREARGEQAEGA